VGGGAGEDAQGAGVSEWACLQGCGAQRRCLWVVAMVVVRLSGAIN
jgi:hypothetical protein